MESLNIAYIHMVTVVTAVSIATIFIGLGVHCYIMVLFY